MTKTHSIKVNKIFDFDFEEEDISKLDASKVSDKNYHVLHNNKSFKTEITEANFNQKSYQVKVNNNTYNIKIVSDLDVLIKEMGFEVGTTKKINEIKAPMPGLILDINVKIGQEVNEDDALLILEAMKMENIITSPRQGVIKSISVKKGDAIEKNQLLITFDA